jgi:hypothetical protein
MSTPTSFVTARGGGYDTLGFRRRTPLSPVVGLTSFYEHANFVSPQLGRPASPSGLSRPPTPTSSRTVRTPRARLKGNRRSPPSNLSDVDGSIHPLPFSSSAYVTGDLLFLREYLSKMTARKSTSPHPKLSHSLATLNALPGPISIMGLLLPGEH